MKIVVDLVNTDLTHVLGLSEKGVVIRPLTPQESEQAVFTMDMMLAIVANTIKKIEQSPCNPAVDKVILVTRGNMLGMALLFALSEFVSDLQMIYVDNTTSKFVDLSHFKSLGYEAGMTYFFLTMEENITF